MAFSDRGSRLKAKRIRMPEKLWKGRFTERTATDRGALHGLDRCRQAPVPARHRGQHRPLPDARQDRHHHGSRCRCARAGAQPDPRRNRVGTLCLRRAPRRHPHAHRVAARRGRRAGGAKAPHRPQPQRPGGARRAHVPAGGPGRHQPAACRAAGEPRCARPHPPRRHSAGVHPPAAGPAGVAGPPFHGLRRDVFPGRGSGSRTACGART